MITDVFDAVGNRNTRQGCATGERMLTDVFDTVGNRNTRQGCATGERRASDARDAVGNSKVRCRFSGRITNQRRPILTVQNAIL